MYLIWGYRAVESYWIDFDLTIVLIPTNLEVDRSFLRFGTECCDRILN